MSDAVTCVVCGAEIEVPESREGWDIVTDSDGKIVERHLVLPCPACGSVGGIHANYDDDTSINIVREAAL